MLSKIKIHKSDFISIFLLLSAAILTLFPPHFWVTGFLFCAVGLVFFFVPRLKSIRFRRILILLSALCLCVLEIATSFIWVYGSRDNRAAECPVAVVLGAQVNGQTPSKILRERLDAALALAKENPDLLVSDIAYRVGFKDPKYFATSFKKEMGVQPKEYFSQMRG